jgi:hypothetical protein
MDCCNAPRSVYAALHQTEFAWVPPPTQSQDPTEPSLCRVFFFGCLIRIHGRHVTIRSPGRWPDTARSAAQPSELRYPPIPSSAPAFTRSGAARQAFMTPERRAAGQRPGLRIFTGPLGLGSIDQRIRMHDRSGYRASGRTICTRLNSVLPGSSHGTMCAECSNHTPCLYGACTVFNQRSVGAVGVV